MARYALVMSAVVHAVVVVVVARHIVTISFTTPDAPAPTPPLPTPTAPPDDEVAVTLLHIPDAPVESTPDREPQSQRRQPAHREIATTPPSSNVRSPPGTEPPPGPPGSNPLRMRRGPDLSVSDKATTDFLARSKPLAAPEAPHRQLEQHGREYVVHDSVTTMRVAEDGHATFTDKPDIDFHQNIPTSARGPDEAPSHPGDSQVAAPEGQESDLPSSGASGVFTGSVDATSYLMRKTGLDPYAMRKLKMLDDTRDERAAIGAEHAKRQLGRSAELMQRNVAELWKATVDPAARRAALFAMWDECEEGDTDRGQSGQRARALVIGWIRTHLPAGSATAFTPAEVAALDGHRTSRQHFAPY